MKISKAAEWRAGIALGPWTLDDLAEAVESLENAGAPPDAEITMEGLEVVARRWYFEGEDDGADIAEPTAPVTAKP